MPENLPPVANPNLWQWAAVAVWLIVGLLAYLLRQRPSGASRALRQRALELGPVRSVRGPAIAGAAIVAALLSVLFLTGLLMDLERPVREQMWHLRMPFAARVIPEASIVDVCCEQFPLRIARQIIQRAHDEGARAVVLPPPGQMRRLRNIAETTESGYADESPVLAPTDRVEQGALSELREVITALPRMYVVRSDTSYRSGSWTEQESPLPRVGHLRRRYGQGYYQVVNLSRSVTGQVSPSVAVLLAADLAGIPLDRVQIKGLDELTIGGYRIPLNNRGNLIVASMPGRAVTRTVQLYNAEKFARFAMSSDQITPDTTWKEFCKDKIVLIGPVSDAGGVVPPVTTAYRAANTLVAHIETGMGRRPPGSYLPVPVNRYGGTALIWLVVGLAAIIGTAYRPLPAAILSMGFGLGILVTTVAACLQAQLLLPAGSMLLGLVISSVLLIEASYMTVELQRERILSTFGRYVSGEVAESILRAEKLTLGGESRTVTVMFADIRGFGLVAEELAPEQVVELLNAYFSTMIDVVFEYRGTLDKFVGDSIMAIWGAPVQAPDDAPRAVRAGMAICSAVTALTERRAAEGLPTASIAIGISTGEVVAGNIGDLRRMEYTVIGDAVNVAARLQDMASRGESDMLIGERTYDQVADEVQTRPLGDLQVKHRVRPVRIYEVMCRMDEPAGTSRPDGKEDDS